MSDRILSLAEVSETLAIPAETVLELSRSSKLPGTQIGSTWAFEERAVRRYINKLINRDLQLPSPESYFHEPNSQSVSPLPEIDSKRMSQLHMLANYTPMMIWLGDGQMNCTYCNKAWLDFAGCTFEEFLGDGCTKFIHEEDLQEVNAIIEQAVGQQSPFKMEFRCRRHDGVYRWLSAVGQPNIDEQGQLIGYSGYNIDITEQKQAEQQLRKSEQHLRTITDAIPIFIGYVDDDLRYRFNNAMYENAFGLSRDQIRGMKVSELIGTDAYRTAEPQLKRALRGETVHYRSTNSNVAGRNQTSFDNIFVPDIRDDGSVPGVYVVVTDVTEQEQHRKELMRQKEETQKILDSLPAFVMVKDTQNNVLSVNETASRMLQKTKTEIEGKPLKEALPTSYEICYEDDKRVFETKQAVRGIQRKCFAELGTDKWLRMDKIPVCDENNKIEHILVVATDITEAKQREEELKKASLAAESSMKAKSEFLANMSHEIRTPMSAILGYLDILEDELTAEPHVSSMISTIKRNGYHLLQIINDILDFSKIEAGKLELDILECSPHDLLHDLETLMKLRAQDKQIDLIFQTDLTVPRVILSDPTRLRQILWNLLSNAIKFTSEGGVTVRSTCMTDERGQQILQIAVKDSGIGMTQDQTARIFEKFSQADCSTTRKYGGTGLGLSISQHLAKMLGGKLSVESVHGIGSTFTLLLPLTEHSTSSVSEVFEASGHDITTTARERKKQPASPRAAESEPETQPEQNSIAGCRVLVVEDGTDNQRLISFILRKAGAIVEVANNGKIGFDQAVSAQDQNKPFDVILMDMQMPVLDGYAATRKLRQNGYTRPIIALTAHATKGDRHKCMSAGCDDFATKPINKPQLLQLIADYRQHVLNAR